MLFTKASEYALLSLIYISQKETPQDVDSLALELDIPKSFLAKILQTLAKDGLLKSFKGAKGGFVLIKEPSQYVKDMSKNKNLDILNIDEKDGGTLLYKINNQACVGIELTRYDSRMAMKIYGIENLDKECKLFIQSPSFKDLSYTKKDFKWYYLE